MNIDAFKTVRDNKSYNKPSKLLKELYDLELFLAENNLKYQYPEGELYKGLLLFNNNVEYFNIETYITNDILVYTLLGLNCEFLITKYGICESEYIKLINTKLFEQVLLVNISLFNSYLYNVGEKAYSSLLKKYAINMGFIAG